MKYEASLALLQARLDRRPLAGGLTLAAKQIEWLFGFPKKESATGPRAVKTAGRQGRRTR